MTLRRTVAFTTQAKDGDARAPGALRRLLHHRSLPTHAAFAQQVHGVEIVRVQSQKKPMEHAAVDGFLTDQPHQPLVIFTADCAPVFMEGAGGEVVGLLHAGWRGVQQGILRQAVRLLREHWRIPAREVRAWMGPAIGPCCFEVQWDVARYFPGARQRRKDRWTVDLGAALAAQARALGVRWEKQKGPQGCTMHDVRYHSYRRNKTKERQASIIMKRASQ